MEAVTEVVSKASDYLWNVILIILLCGTGIYFTIRLKFIQIRKFGEGFKLVFGNISLKGEKGKNGEMTTFQSLATAIAAQVGTGNLAGAATALIGGGPGAIFLDVGKRLLWNVHNLCRGDFGTTVQSQKRRRGDRRTGLLHTGGI